MVEWWAEYSVTIACIVGGMLICTAGGLLSLRPDPEKPKTFLPVYVVSMSIYLFGLALIVWQEALWKNVNSFFA